MHIVRFNSEDVISIEEGSILKYITVEYDKDLRRYIHVFQVIGDPVEGDNAGVSHYTFKEGEPFVTHIKIV